MQEASFVRFVDDEANMKEMTLWTQVWSAIAGNLLFITCGFSIGYTAPIMEDIKEEFNLSTFEAIWFASILVVGQIIGCLLGGPCCDLIGRRRSIQCFAFAELSGWLLLSQAQHPSLLILSRFLIGLANCLASSPCVLYLAEVTHVRYQSLALALITTCACCGVPLAYVVGHYLSWRASALVGMAFPLTVLLMHVLTHESPLHLLKKGREREARAALRWYRGPRYDHAQELRDMQVEIANNVSLQRGRSLLNQAGDFLYSLSDRDTLIPVAVVYSLFMLVPMTGVFSISFFAIGLFRSLGFRGDAMWISVLMAGHRALGSLFSTYLLFRYGRRKVALASTYLSTICMTLVAAAVVIRSTWHLNDADESLTGYVLVAGICGFMFFLGCGLSSMPWILMGEWFLPENKAIISGTGTALFYAAILLSLQIISYLNLILPPYGTFLVYVAACVLLSIISYFGLIETDGKTYKESIEIIRRTSNEQEGTFEQEKGLLDESMLVTPVV